MVDPATTPQAQVVWDAPAAFVVSLRWRPAGEPAVRQMYQVLRVRDGEICEIADFKQLGPATKTAKRFAAA